MSNPFAVLSPTGAGRSPQALDKLKAERVELFLKRTPEWQLVRGGTALSRRLRFTTPAGALAFVAVIARLAEAVGRQPQIRLQGSSVWVSLTTPAAGGLTAADLTLARRIQEQARL